MDDLEQSLRVVKPGGIIAGDDLHTHKWGPEIKRALEWFMDKYDSDVELLWVDSDPFVIRVK